MVSNKRSCLNGYTRDSTILHSVQVEL